MFEPLQPSSGGPLPDRGRWRNAVNALVCVAGVGGLAFGGWALYDSYETHQDRNASRALIARACAGLVDADGVMSLDGGADRVVLGGEDPSTIDFETVPDSCVLSRLEDRDGREYKYSQFTLSLKGLPRARDLHTTDDSRKAPFNRLRAGSKGDATARTGLPDRMPLGDGRLGDYGPDDVTVVARCEQPTKAGTTTLIVSATSPSTRHEAGDRPVLARLARQAAERAAGKYGCRTQLPELPDRLPEPVTGLGPVGERTDSCGWYAAHLRTADRERLPDRAAGVPLAGAAREEGCLLAMSPEGNTRVLRLLTPDEREDAITSLYHSPWWLRTRSYYGDDADAVAVPGRRSPDPVIPGRAGRLGDVFYGSMTCQGRPATLTMAVPYNYRSILGPRLDGLFKAYATETATRRGCTGLVLPGPE
ncbi:hypothetical protein [Streptomyces sp. ISL-94]|uniref:hypothetical protein n=1 Tax=Streptomyces sp. ISL-94 TaxID=2819190 RepID=UPI001BE9A195|nr:hypothetical protein [Streptomyces sp. ISL-94]MBT2478536.1 hypothetical protein [Streptomyces sp. ISL-94]